MAGFVESDIKRYYEEWWENPRDPRDHVFKRLNRLILKKLPPGNGRRALDIGSGKGTIVGFLLEKGYQASAVELNENFVRDLRQRFPMVEVIEGDFNAATIERTFDLVTAVEFIQNLDREALRHFFQKAAALTDHLILTVSNKKSLHGFWAVFRGFIKPFVHVYTPKEIETLIRDSGFEITSRRGIGLLTPITLFSDFRWKLIPVWLTKLVNPWADRLFPRRCHLYYLEAGKSFRKS
jgi:cyclopropane fatty-acyl-phospholipid synthase-like methyltransferase